MKQPVTHAYPWTNKESDAQKLSMREFAEAGETHLVLTNRLLGAACGDPDYLIRFHRKMREFGLDFVDAHALWGTWSDLGLPLEEWHDQLIARHRACIGFCARFGVDTLTFHTGNTLNSVFGQGLRLEDYRKMLIRSLEELLPDAGKYGVVLALENQWTPLNHSRILLEIMERFRSPYLGLCYDAGHGNLMEKGMFFPEETCVPDIWNDLGAPVEWETELVEKFVPWLVNCHLHDNHGVADEHLLPGRGTVDWTRVRNALRRAPRLRNIQNESSFFNCSIRESGAAVRAVLQEA